MLAAGLTATTAGPAQAAAYESSPYGYAAGTTGGAGGSRTTVTTLAALKTAVAGSAAKTVYVSGTIALAGQVDVGSNTSVIGVGAGSGLTGGGLRVKNATNVVLRNLNISKAVGTDAITVQASTKVWVDHNDLSSDRSHGKDYYDGLVDITHGSDNITVSWNKFHDHYKVSLVGHSDSNAAEDTGKLHVTYGHNWFDNVNSRLPSVRFGTAHVYSNYFGNVGDSAVHSRMGAQVLVERNAFAGSFESVTTTGDSKTDGYANLFRNDLGSTTTDITRTGSFTAAPYAYDPTGADTVAAVDTAGAGTGRI
ncbi:polysaccharide lyase family 1 protein [Kitasatospora sp. NPDC007106]|uniref:pectate lyase family protein n=1 Tax=Kitasatospora sp. NPDC007106 TaxID=3156914 RepID=UPI003410F4FE